MKKRKALSKKLRFEIFKRDAFTCQYCGGHPPEQILHVDHIVPVAEGGENNIDNLVTSCSACNLGKGATPLTSVPLSLADKVKLIAEQEEQIRGYNAILRGKRDRVEDEAWEVAEALKHGAMKDGIHKDYFRSIRMFVEKLGVFECLEAADIARSKRPYSNVQAFKYFCGICWNKINREKEVV